LWDPQPDQGMWLLLEQWDLVSVYLDNYRLVGLVDNWTVVGPADNYRLVYPVGREMAVAMAVIVVVVGVDGVFAYNFRLDNQWLVGHCPNMAFVIDGSASVSVVEALPATVPESQLSVGKKEPVSLV
jgi:hypothetical protein